MPAKFFAYSAMALAIILVIAVGAFAVGYELGRPGDCRQPSAITNGLNVISLPEPAVVKTVSGQIKIIGNDYLLVGTRKAVINSQTKILRRRLKNLAELKARPDGEAPATPFVFEPIKKSDLKIGDKVTAAADENIKDKTEFIAVSIILTNI